MTCLPKPVPYARDGSLQRDGNIHQQLDNEEHKEDNAAKVSYKNCCVSGLLKPLMYWFDEAVVEDGWVLRRMRSESKYVGGLILFYWRKIGVN